MKDRSIFYPTGLREQAQANIRQHAWAAEVRDTLVANAGPWMQLSDDELWSLMFGSTIRRSWMVWSNGYCPACHEDVPMYNWRIKALEHPWKLRCPHCEEYFPKNDFQSFYRSGIDEHGIFDDASADRSLLFNVEHPDPDDALHQFGVDDGDGYVEGENRWRFIGAYLIYGQWKQAVLGGIRSLAAAHVATGEAAYAHKAGVLLDRVADLYPTFDFLEQGFTYEQQARELDTVGYVSCWHDACEETRELAMAYDQVFEALVDDAELITFLSAKALQFKLDNPKTSFADVQRNIENGILRDAIENRHKIRSNYPRTDIAIAVLKTVLEWPRNRGEVTQIIDELLQKSTAVDGVTGEKGLSNYSAFAIQALGLFLGQYSRLEPGFLRDTLQRHPRLHQTFRFHIDTFCLDKYYPLIGDTGWFAQPFDRPPYEGYQGLTFIKLGQSTNWIIWDWGLAPSMFTFLWNLYQLTGDVAFAQVLYNKNGNTVDGLPHDLFASDMAAMQEGVRAVIDGAGSTPQLGSIDKQEWHLAILRSGQGENARAAWLDYDTGGAHAHADGMNLGLFAKGLDLMPDFGYPPVQFGGWSAPRSRWYAMTAAHNTVAVDGKDQHPAYSGILAGATTLWADGKQFQAMRASGAVIIGGQQYERTIATVAIGENDFYLIDIFRVIGGSDHAKFMHSHFGTITTNGLNLQPAPEYGHETQMRNFECDPSPQSGWSVDWKIEDRYKLLSPDADIHLRYTDLTSDAQAFTAEGWVVTGAYDMGGEETWIPRVLVRQQSDEDATVTPLASTFVSVIEPYENTSNIAYIRRLSLTSNAGTEYSDANVALEIELANGACDLLIALDVENPLGLSPSRAEDRVVVQAEWGVLLDGELCLLRRDQAGQVCRIVLCHGNSVSVGDVSLVLKREVEFIEIIIDGNTATVSSGAAEDIQDILIAGKSALK